MPHHPLPPAPRNLAERGVKIICTIGPASASPAILEALLESGMNVARFNMSHGTHHWHAETMQTIRQVAHRKRKPLAILLDLQGPRIRVGTLPDQGILIHEGQRIRLTPEKESKAMESPPAPTITTIPIAYPTLLQDIKPGARILINDGLLVLEAMEATEEGLTCHVLTGGLVSSHKGVNLPGTMISSPALTDKDKKDVQFGLAQQVDYLALSFVRSPADITELQEYLNLYKQSVPIIAKIERAEAVECLDAILDLAEGVMLARGDLAIEMSPETVPVLQKRIIAQANRRRRVVITATQMLESMTQHPTPTRAEASDVANAVFDGTDAVMLSAETSQGRYPVESVLVMDRIIRAAEGGGIIRHQDGEVFHESPITVPEAVCEAAASAARAIPTTAIVTFSESGATTLFMSKQRPAVPIFGLTPSPSTQRRMLLYRGVTPYLIPIVNNTDDRLSKAELLLKQEKRVKAGDRLIMISGEQVGRQGGTNLMKVHEVTPDELS